MLMDLDDDFDFDHLHAVTKRKQQQKKAQQQQQHQQQDQRQNQPASGGPAAEQSNPSSNPVPPNNLMDLTIDLDDSDSDEDEVGRAQHHGDNSSSINNNSNLGNGNGSNAGTGARDPSWPAAAAELHTLPQLPPGTRRTLVCAVGWTATVALAGKQFSHDVFLSDGRTRAAARLTDGTVSATMGISAPDMAALVAAAGASAAEQARLTEIETRYSARLSSTHHWQLSVRAPLPGGPVIVERMAEVSDWRGLAEQAAGRWRAHHQSPQAL
jgi:hypothetical protein